MRAFLRNPLGRTLALWALMMVMFLVVWQGLRSAQTPTPEPSATAREDYSTPAITKFAPVVLIGLVGVLFFATMARARRFNSASAAGLQALAEGDFTRAADALAEVSRKYRWPAQLSGIATFNLGIARLHQGQLGHAIDCFARVERKRSWALAGIRASLAGYVALAYALRGDVESARRWRAAAEDCRKNAPDPRVVVGLLAWVDAVVDVREARYESFLRWLDERWRQLEGGLTARTTRPLRVLRAFATARVPGAGPRDAGAVEKLVSELKPAHPGEFAMLQAEWPEMAAFLSAEGL